MCAMNPLLLYMAVKMGYIFIGVWLKDGGWLCVECGYTQGDAIKKLWQLGGLQSVEICQDYAGKDRMVIGQKIGSNRQEIK